MSEKIKNDENEVKAEIDLDKVITKSNFKTLENMLEEKIKKRDEIALRLKEARSEGDLSENAEYEIAKEDQGNLEGDITAIENDIKNVTIVEKIKKSSIFIGNTVTLKANNKKSKDDKFLLISPLEKYYIEFDDIKVIPVDSPKGELVLNKKVSDVVDFGEKSWIITKIE